MTDTASARTGANIRAEMARHKVSQTTLAAHLGISQASLSDRIRGKVPVDVNELDALAEFFGVPAAAFIASVPA